MSELVAAFPDAKYILILRHPESWVDSYLETNEVFNAGLMAFPPELSDWLAMLCPVLARMGFSPGLVGKALIAAFNAHSVHQ